MSDDTPLPRRIDDGDVVLRAWTRGDAGDLQEAIVASVEHLRPWMPWIAFEPQTVEQRRALIAQWTWQAVEGGDAHYGIFLDGAVAGAAGLHRRRGPGVLEIGYWLRPERVGQGLATRTAGLLTAAAFAMDGIDAVEIHHDEANTRSGAVPRRLGFTRVSAQPDEREAPGEVGIDCTWRIDRATWAARG